MQQQGNFTIAPLHEMPMEEVKAVYLARHEPVAVICCARTFLSTQVSATLLQNSCACTWNPAWRAAVAVLKMMLCKLSSSSSSVRLHTSCEGRRVASSQSLLQISDALRFALCRKRSSFCNAWTLHNISVFTFFQFMPRLVDERTSPEGWKPCTVIPCDGNIWKHTP